MRVPRVPISRLMAVVAVLALDFAVLRAIWPRIPDLGLVVMVGVLEITLLSPATRRAPGHTFWLAFEAAGWAYVLVAFAWSRWVYLFDRAIFERFVLGARIGQPGQMNRFLLFAGGLNLVGSLITASLFGVTVSRVVKMRQDRSGGIRNVITENTSRVP